VYDARSSENDRIGLWSPGFLALLFTQFLTAVNDNVFRWLAIGIGKDSVPAGEHAWVLMIATFCFVLPYIVFAAVAGFLADRFSKRQVIVWCKFAEIVVMLLGTAAIVSGNLYGLFVVVFMMGAQSALFAPAKLGAIPEILPPRHIPGANGVLGLATIVASIVGMALGSHLKDITGYKGQQEWWKSGFVLMGIAAVGWLISLAIPRTAAGDTLKRFPWRSITAAWAELKLLWQNRPLFRAALGLVFFWGLGSLAQLNIDQFALEAGAITEVAKTPLLGGLILGVGCGSVLAAVLSRGRIELTLLPAGATGIFLAACSMFFVEPDFFNPLLPAAQRLPAVTFACALLFLLGCSAGLFSIPLDSYLQYRSPPAVRGTVLAATNLLIFVGILAFSGLYYGLRLPLRPALSWEDFPETLRTFSSEQERQNVELLCKQLREESRPAPTDSFSALQDYVRRLGRSSEAAFARLLFEEVKAREGRGETPLLKEYTERFPEYAHVVLVVFRWSHPRPLFSARAVFVLAGLGTIPVLLYIAWVLPQECGRFLAWVARWTIYRVRIYGKQHIPQEGPALLVSNHVTWIDAALLLLTTPRRIRYVAWAGNFSPFVLRWFSEMGGAIMLVPSNPKSVIRALRQAREALLQGDLVCIFPEGGITRSGQLLGFRPGVMRILEGTDVPVVPIYLDELWGSIFSFSGGKFFWKFPKRFPYPISIHIGEPLRNPPDAYSIRQAILALGASAMQQRRHRMLRPAQMAVRSLKKRPRAVKVVDSTGTSLSGASLLARSLVLRRLLRRHVFQPDEQHIGILLPPTVPAVAANLAVSLDRRVACNLNYSATSDIINACIAQAGIRHVLTSRRFMEKMNFDIQAELVYLEDFRDQVTLWDKIIGFLLGYVCPSFLVDRLLGLNHIDPDDTLTIIFTSGSTGTPKGVMLTHANVAHNVAAVDQIVHLRPSDVVIGILPFFHSFGYTVTLWTALCKNIIGAYHFSPLDAKQIGSLCRKHRGTILLATPTFLRSYVRRVEKEDFATLDVVVTGAEKLPRELADAFEQKFGIRPVEGYGTTELSPLVSVNIPPSRALAEFQSGSREGSVGRPVPGVAVKVVHPETGADLGCGQEGLLLVRGPNVMKGYYGRPDLTAQVVRDGWYVTGDMARIDEDGFIFITGRLSRFSKIGGEMVPHGVVEEQLNRLLGAEEDGQLKAAVTAIPDERKGERLVVVHLPMEKTPEELCKALMDSGLPNLYIPSADSFIQVEELPILGSGKLDLKRLQQIAFERFPGSQKDQKP